MAGRKDEFRELKIWVSYLGSKMLRVLDRCHSNTPSSGMNKNGLIG
ncbi:WD repeat protein [Aspergillus luchuensis]|uniref:WD repeat protein n=1 Tax=Aspergillus kawachii TaxID=1069201 RepID=A0A146FBG7_ASPKA|nr:WD repeat protein [Aspergillus luchuensis]